MRTTDTKQIHVPKTSLGTQLMHGLVLGLLIGLVANLIFIYALLSQETEVMTVVKAINSGHKLIVTVKRFSEFLAGGAIVSLFAGIIVLPFTILAGGVNGASTYLLTQHPKCQLCSGVLIGLATGAILIYFTLSMGILNNILMAIAILLAAAGGIVHTLMLQRWQ